MRSTIGTCAPLFTIVGRDDTMQMTLRWFGADDAVPLEHIRQIPGVTGIVSALHAQRPGDVWPQEEIDALRDKIGEAGLSLAVIESIPVHEDIKLGRPTRDRHVDSWCETVRRIGAAGVPVVCYNFMPIFDWLRTDLARAVDDGSTTLAYDHAELAAMDLSSGLVSLPAWADAYDGATLSRLLAEYRQLHSEQLWENFAWFLERVVPVAEEVGVRLAIHPDDPPWPVFGVPRIVVDAAAFTRLVGLVDRPANGVTFCTGSLGSSPANDLPAMIRALGDRIHFMHCRNVRRTGDRSFVETPHPSAYGDVNMREVLRALRDTGFSGPMRPDHGRMIWGETGRVAYGLHDRALGAMYLQGLWEGLAPCRDADEAKGNA